MPIGKHIKLNLSLKSEIKNNSDHRLECKTASSQTFTRKHRRRSSGPRAWRVFGHDIKVQSIKKYIYILINETSSKLKTFALWKTSLSGGWKHKLQMEPNGEWGAHGGSDRRGEPRPEGWGEAPRREQERPEDKAPLMQLCQAWVSYPRVYGWESDFCQPCPLFCKCWKLWHFFQVSLGRICNM